MEFWLILAAVIALLGLRRIRGNERVVVFRLGRIDRIVGTKYKDRWYWVMPVIETILKVELMKAVPEWR